MILELLVELVLQEWVTQARRVKQVRKENLDLLDLLDEVIQV